MKRIIIGFLIVALFIPLNAKAKTQTFNVCKSGCEYNDIYEVWLKVNQINSNDDVIINFKDEGPYNFLDGALNTLPEDNYSDDFETYDVDLIIENNTHGFSEYYCDDGGTLISVYDDRVLDYNTRTNKCTLLRYPEEAYKHMVYLANSKVNSITVNGKEDTKTIIDIMDTQADDSLLKGYARLFFTGFLNVKNAYFNNIDLIGSFYSGASSEGLQDVHIDNCNLRYGLIAYNTNVTISNSDINRVYSINSNSHVFLRQNNRFINNNYLFPNLEDVINYGSSLTQEEIDYFIDKYYDGFEDDIFNFDGLLANDSINLIINLLGLDSNNTLLLEIDEGEIYFMDYIKMNVKINTADIKSVKSIFKDLSKNDYDFKVDDSSIIEIKNGNIIPKKAGRTKIYFMSADGVKYQLEVEITDSIINPNTHSGITLVISVLGAVFLTVITIKKRIKIITN